MPKNIGISLAEREAKLQPQGLATFERLAKCGEGAGDMQMSSTLACVHDLLRTMRFVPASF
jgi:hypothetical protein